MRTHNKTIGFISMLHRVVGCEIWTENLKKNKQKLATDAYRWAPMQEPIHVQSLRNPSREWLKKMGRSSLASLANFSVSQSHPALLLKHFVSLKHPRKSLITRKIKQDPATKTHRCQSIERASWPVSYPVVGTFRSKKLNAIFLFVSRIGAADAERARRKDGGSRRKTDQHLPNSLPQGPSAYLCASALLFFLQPSQRGS
ncbi:MAG: hypothetical protein Q8O00_16615 [Holophaga sp.]|nr:hypothetical protein [Holophaga sp.]